jgi:hypothetical protein
MVLCLRTRSVPSAANDEWTPSMAAGPLAPVGSHKQLRPDQHAWNGNTNARGQVRLELVHDDIADLVEVVGGILADFLRM